MVTSLPDEHMAIARNYRNRIDCENCFDELKNRWCWGGYPTKDLSSCLNISRLVALVYNWWSLFTRPDQARQTPDELSAKCSHQPCCCQNPNSSRLRDEISQLPLLG